jgi:hypothetical protein
MNSALDLLPASLGAEFTELRLGSSFYTDGYQPDKTNKRSFMVYQGKIEATVKRIKVIRSRGANLSKRRLRCKFFLKM